MYSPLTIPKSNQVASPVKFFVGREEEISLAVKNVSDSEFGSLSENICVIYGEPGIGKTDFCNVVAHQLRDQFSDAQIYIKVIEGDTDEVSLFNILEVVIHIIDPHAQISDDLNTLHRQFYSLLDGKKVLIILDDFQSQTHVDLLMLPSSCALLIASHEKIEIVNARTIFLDRLSQENSASVLKRISHILDNDALTLSRICDYLPVNLCLVANYIVSHPELALDEFIPELEKYIKRPTENVESISKKLFDYIFEHLTAFEQNFFSELAVFPDGFNRELVLELRNFVAENDVDAETFEKYLDAYTQMGLLVYNEDTNYYRMHPVIKAHALKNLNHAAKAWLRLGKVYAASIPEYTSLAKRGVDGYILSSLIFDEHKKTIKSILQYLLTHPSVDRDQVLVDFYDLISLFRNTRFAVKNELIPLLIAIMKACVRLSDKEKLVPVLGELSTTYHKLGDEEKARDYSKLYEKMLITGQAHDIKQVFENIGNREFRNQLGVDMLDKTPMHPIPFALEEFSNKKTKIILTGFMGTGKTTVGKLLADYLNYRFIDTDELIESRNNRSVSDIFLELGEEAFREMERKVVYEIAELDSVVVSTGGRLMLDPENVKALSHNSRVLCLVATPDEILSRVLDDKEHERPLLSVPNPKERIVELLQERDDKYLRFPQIVTDEKKPADIAKGLVEFINTEPTSLTIENPQNSYEYVVGAGLLPFIKQLTSIEGEAIIVTDEDVNAFYGPSCSSIGHIIEIPSGRQNKSLITVQSVYDQLLERGFDRSGTIIALGGSVVGDIAGYVAATYMRGVNFVQCPTSLISMVDTSVGGKTSIDLPQGKNMIGVYKQPTKIIVDVATLRTLPQVDFASGMAEVIKHGLIAESNLLEHLEQGFLTKNWDRSPSYVGDLQRLVAQAIQVKINIVQADPFDQGRRSILNLGHTFAYAIEQVSNNAYRHGEAVSIGLVAAANLSARLGFCDISLQERIEAILENVNLPTRIPSNLKPDALLQAMQHDKKKRAGQLRFILIRGIGQAFVSDKVSNEELLATLSSLSD